MWRPLTRDELTRNFRSRVPDLIGPVQVLVSVPKKKRRKAVDRVLMRRRIREAFRLNRHAILDAVAEFPQIRTLSIGLVYMKEANVSFNEIEDKLQKLIAKLTLRLNDKYAEETVDTAD